MTCPGCTATKAAGWGYWPYALVAGEVVGHQEDLHMRIGSSCEL